MVGVKSADSMVVVAPSSWITYEQQNEAEIEEHGVLSLSVCLQILGLFVAR